SSTPAAGPLARLRLAERGVVAQLEATAAEVDAIGTTALDQAEARLAEALARLASRLSQASARTEQMLGEALARLEAMAGAIAADVAASKALGGEAQQAENLTKPNIAAASSRPEVAAALTETADDVHGDEHHTPAVQQDGKASEATIAGAIVGSV